MKSVRRVRGFETSSSSAAEFLRARTVEVSSVAVCCIWDHEVIITLHLNLQ